MCFRSLGWIPVASVGIASFGLPCEFVSVVQSMDSRVFENLLVLKRPSRCSTRAEHACERTQKLRLEFSAHRAQPQQPHTTRSRCSVKDLDLVVFELPRRATDSERYRVVPGVPVELIDFTLVVVGTAEVELDHGAARVVLRTKQRIKTRAMSSRLG